PNRRKMAHPQGHLALFRELASIAQEIEQNLLEPYGVRVERAQVLLSSGGRPRAGPAHGCRRQRACSSDHASLSRPMVEAQSLPASLPSNAISASSKSPVETPLR